MTEPRPSGPPMPFTAAELDGASGLHADELAGDTRMARDLETLAARTTNPPPAASAAFADRVMTAVAAEPVPAPARLAGRALRRGSLSALLLSLRDAWRVTTSTGFPMAARAQAMALVLVVAALVTGSSMVTAGALGLLGTDHATPAPSLERPSGPAETPTSATGTPEPTEDASASPDASESPTESSAEPDASASPGGSIEDHGGAGISGGGAQATSAPDRTPSATASDHEDHSPSPSSTAPRGTPGPSESPHGD